MCTTRLITDAPLRESGMMAIEEPRLQVVKEQRPEGGGGEDTYEIEESPHMMQTANSWKKSVGRITFMFQRISAPLGAILMVLTKVDSSIRTKNENECGFMDLYK